MAQEIMDLGYIASDAITKFRAVRLLTSDTSGKQCATMAAGGADDIVLGVAQESTHASGVGKQVVAVRLMGVSKVECGGSVTINGLVMTDADGKAVAVGATADENYALIGRALESGANGQLIDVFLMCGQTWSTEAS